MPEDEPNLPPTRATERAVGRSVERFLGLSKEQIREALRADLQSQSLREFRPAQLTGIPTPPRIETDHMEFQRSHSGEVTPPPKPMAPEGGPGLGGGGVYGIVPPFYVEFDAISGGGEIIVKVKPGFVNNIIPTTIGGTDNWKFVINANQWIYLDAELGAGGDVTGAKLRMASSVPANPDGNPTTGTAPANTYLAVAQLVYNSVDNTVIIANFLGGSQYVQAVVSSWSCSAQVVRTLWSQV